METFHTLITRCKKPSAKLSFWRAQYRADLCASIFNTFPPIFKDFHDSYSVKQVNGVPEGSSCIVTGERLNDGIQLKFNKRHICIHYTHYLIWYHYFRIRHFPSYIYNNIYGKPSTDKQEKYYEDLAEKMWDKSTSVLRKYLSGLYK